MSLQPTNIPQLQNMGLTPAANMVNTGISAMISAREGGRDRRNKLLQALLGGAVDMGVQGLRNKGDLATIEAQLKSPAQLALAVNRLATGAASPDQAGAIRDRVNRILGDIPGTNKEGQAPILPLEGSPIVDQVGDDAVQTFGGQGGITGVPQGQEFAQSPSGAFQLGAQQQVASASPSYGMDLPLGMARQQAQIARNLSSESLNRARENKTYVDTDRSREQLAQERIKTDEKRYGKQWFDNITAVQSPGEQAKSTTGLPMKGLVVTPELAEDQMNIARQYANDPKAYDKRLATLQKDTEGVVPLLNKMSELKKLVKPGVQAQIQRNTETGEYIISVTGSKQSARIKSILNSIAAQVPMIARLYGNSGVLTEPDVQRTLQDIPNALGSKELFDEQYKNFAEALSYGALSEAARLKNKRINDTFQSIYKNATDQDFTYGGGISFAGGGFTGGQAQDLRMQVLEELREEKQRGF